MTKITILDLPVEILEKIFLFVSKSKIRPGIPNKKISTLTEVCKKFKDVIESSSCLVGVFHAVFDNDKRKDFQVILGSRREYGNVAIISYNSIPETIHKFIARQSFITSLTIDWSTVKVSDLNLIFTGIAKSLEKVCIIKVKLIENDAAANVELPKLKYLILNDNECDNMMKYMLSLMKNAKNITKFENRSGTVNEENERICAEVVRDLNYLRELNLEKQDGELLLFKNEFKTIQKTLKLENFCIYLHDNVFENTENWSNFLNFLQSQKETLKKLSITNFPQRNDIVDIIFSMKHLKSLTINACDDEVSSYHNISSKLTELKDLTISTFPLDCYLDSQLTVCDMLRNCPNIESLELGYLELYFPVCFNIRKNLSCLKKLYLEKCKGLIPVKIASLEIFKATGCDFESVLGFVLVNKHIKNFSDYFDTA